MESLFLLVVGLIEGGAGFDLLHIYVRSAVIWLIVFQSVPQMRLEKLNNERVTSRRAEGPTGK